MGVNIRITLRFGLSLDMKDFSSHGANSVGLVGKADIRDDNVFIAILLKVNLKQSCPYTAVDLHFLSPGL